MAVKSYRYVIVGAGAAGCVLANRLSADPRNEVLLIEAGGRDRSPLLHAPGAMFAILQRGLYSWIYPTEPQSHLHGRTLVDIRGKVVGGSTSINGVQYCRGSRRDYDHWRDLGNDGWSFEELLPYFKRSETSSRGESTFRGGFGPLHVTRAETRHPVALAWVAAALEAGYAYNDDSNGGRREGFGPQDETLHAGRRMSAAVAYLKPVMRRPNLTLLTHAMVLGLTFQGRRCTGVEYDRGGRVQRVAAEGAVILSAGVFGSPQLLMLSGIGAAAALQAHGIASRVDLPGVGRNFHDHIGFWVSMTCTQPITDFRFTKPMEGLKSVFRHVVFRKGPLAQSSVRAIGLVGSEFAEPGWPDLKLQCVTALVEGAQMQVSRHGFLARVAMTRPASRGEVTLRSADPRVAPRIDAHYFEDPGDIARARAGVRIAREIFQQPALDSYRGEEVAPGPDVTSDSQIDAWLRQTAGPDLHGVGTCRMGRDSGAVVDPQLRVHGIEGLRVIDASVMPTIVSGNTAAPTMMIAEKGADMILEAR